MEYRWNFNYFICYLVSVQLDVRINEWFGEFYDTLKALTNLILYQKKFIAIAFAKIAAIYISGYF